MMKQLQQDNPMHTMDDGQIPLGLHISITSLHDIDTTKELATVCFGELAGTPPHL